MRKVWCSIPGMVKSAECRQRLASAATFLWYPGAKSRSWTPVKYARGVGSQHSPLDDCRKTETFFFTNFLFFLRSLPKSLSCFFCSVHLSHLISRNYHYDQYSSWGGMPSFRKTTLFPHKTFSVNHSLTNIMIIPSYVCVKSCTILHKCFYNSSTDYDAMLQYRYPVVQLFCCVLLELHFRHWGCCEAIEKWEFP